jgi:AraC-like DNA-binding protein
MVSLRCKMLVRNELKKLGLHFGEIDLGMVELSENIDATQRALLHKNLLKVGLELLDDKSGELVEKIKAIIIELVHYEKSNKVNDLKLSNYLVETLGHDFKYLYNLFAEVKGVSIEHFIVLNKIERVKELMLYNQLSIKEIANNLDYHSIPHLTGQFKKVTGLSPSYFKKLADNKRRIALTVL